MDAHECWVHHARVSIDIVWLKRAGGRAHHSRGTLHPLWEEAYPAPLALSPLALVQPHALVQHSSALSRPRASVNTAVGTVDRICNRFHEMYACIKYIQPRNANE